MDETGLPESFLFWDGGLEGYHQVFQKNGKFRTSLQRNDTF